MRTISRCLILFILLLVVYPALAQDDSNTDNPPLSTPNLPITDDVNYTVRPSDTLDGIGAYFDVSPICIAQSNGYTIYDWVPAGEVLRIPVSCPRYGEDPAYFATNTVLVAREVVNTPECDGLLTGSADTVESLSKMLGVSEDALREANQLTDDSTLVMNTCLTIPAPDDETAGAGGGGGINGEFYVVGLRESLDEIAFAHDVSLQSLIIANHIEDYKSLIPGQSIFIPADAPKYGVYPAIRTASGDETLGAGGGGGEDGDTYVIQPLDTLDGIALAHDVSLQSLMMANGLEGDIVDDLKPGTVLVIPTDAPPYGVYPAMRTVSGDETDGAGGGAGVEGETYVLQPLDTMEEIARRFDVDVKALMEANGNPNVLKLLAGTVIIIPDNAPPFVEPGTIPDPEFTPAGDSGSGDNG